MYFTSDASVSLHNEIVIKQKPYEPSTIDIVSRK